MRKWLPLTAVCLGAFMLLVDVTIVTVALPDMAADMHSGFSRPAVGHGRLRHGPRRPAARQPARSPTGSAAAASTWAGSPCSPPPRSPAGWPPAPAP